MATVHVVAAPLALLTALAVVLRRKGTAAHVRLGRVYVALLLVVDASALSTFEATGAPGAFHVLAVISLGTLSAGVLASPRRLGARVPHAVLMAWSVTGLVAAGLAQGMTALLPQSAPWPTVLTTAAACVVALGVTSRLRRRAR